MTRNLTALLCVLLALFCPTDANSVESAIGRLNYAGYRQRMHCSATLIAPRLALTAAHCINNRNVTDMHFLPGYDRGEWSEELKPESAAKLPPRDVAVLCLQQSAQSRAIPLASSEVRIGEQLTVIGYPIPGMHVQNRMTCKADRIGGVGSFSLACPMKPGASGSPVLRQTANGFELVGVISATNATRSLAYGVSSDLMGKCQ
jgi:V8-like Glu-specific endopeptidase